MIMIQGGTLTHDQANGLPYSNQLSYGVLWQPVVEFEYIRLSCQGSRLVYVLADKYCASSLKFDGIIGFWILILITDSSAQGRL